MRKLLAFATTALVALIALMGPASNVAAQTVSGSAAAGEKKAAMCIGCHSIPGYQASFPEVHKVPMIAGQNAKYLQSALNAYKAGDRKHPTMKAIAASLSDQDIADLAAYYETLPAEKTTLPAEPEHKPSTEVAELLKKGNCVSCHGPSIGSASFAGGPGGSGTAASIKQHSTHPISLATVPPWIFGTSEFARPGRTSIYAPGSAEAMQPAENRLTD